MMAKNWLEKKMAKKNEMKEEIKRKSDSYVGNVIAGIVSGTIVFFGQILLEFLEIQSVFGKVIFAFVYAIMVISLFVLSIRKIMTKITV